MGRLLGGKGGLSLIELGMRGWICVECLCRRGDVGLAFFVTQLCVGVLERMWCLGVWALVGSEI